MPPLPAPVFGGSDDFGRIEGIEPWIAELLRMSGVADISALADFECEDWLGQACRLRDGVHRTGDVDAHQAGGFSLFFDVVRDEHGEKVWQTRIYHEESGQEVELPGIESGPWAAWILSPALPEVERHSLKIRILGARLADGDGAPGHPDDRSVEVRLHVSGLPEIEQALGRAALGAVLGTGWQTPAHQGGT